MKSYFQYLFAVLLVVFSIVTTPAVFAFEAQPVRFNNENWFTLTHPKVVSFTVRSDGSAYGSLETGAQFVQYNVPNALGLRIQRFEIDDHYHYIVEGREVYQFEELSRELARAYNERMSV